MSPASTAEASVNRTAPPSTATFVTLTAEPATSTVNALRAGTEPSSSASSYVSTSVAPFTVAGFVSASAGAVVSGVLLVTARSSSAAASLPAASWIGFASGTV